MTSLLFVVAVAVLFAALLSFESSADPTQPKLKQFGLVTWLVSGNWPAKVGAGLLILGIGALLRYALIHVDVPPQIKLGSGLVMAAILGGAATLLKDRRERRAIHLALAGAAFGVAYLTAYSAYGFFGYINDINALALLVLVAVAAGVFAVSSNALSVAILAMAGAYIAPAFALGKPGPVPVYGYYLAVSALSFTMVMMRGWRALIHLSFLFTLAGGLFFGWAAKFYQPEYYSVMQPLLLALVMLHLAMPLVERQKLSSSWLTRFDSGYFVSLPVVAGILTLMIAPTRRVEGSIGLLALALIWTLAAMAVKTFERGDAIRYARVAALFAVGVVLCRLDEVPFSLLMLAVAVAALGAAPYLGLSRSVENLACGAALLCASFHVLGSIMESTPNRVFVNQVFMERIAAAVLLGIGARISSQRGISFAGILGVTAVGWAALATVAELWRLNIDFLPQLVYGILLAATLTIALVARRRPLVPALIAFVMLALTCCGWWTAHAVSDSLRVACFALTAVVLFAVARIGKDAARDTSGDFSSVTALTLLPFSLLPWAISIEPIVAISPGYFIGIVAVTAAMLAIGAASLWHPASDRWNDARGIHFGVIAFVLITATLFHIERGMWPVVFEILALLYLISYTVQRAQTGPVRLIGSGTVMIIAVTLVLQAMLLRVFGEDQIMTVADLGRMKLPAVVSLVWAILGAGLAWWGVKVSSRSVWSAGTALLAVAAVKLVLFDFGSLGQLGNIVALIAAGLLFLGVAWLAPMPPKPVVVAGD